VDGDEGGGAVGKMQGLVTTIETVGLFAATAPLPPAKPQRSPLVRYFGPRRATSAPPRPAHRRPGGGILLSYQRNLQMSSAAVAALRGRCCLPETGPLRGGEKVRLLGRRKSTFNVDAVGLGGPPDRRLTSASGHRFMTARCHYGCEKIYRQPRRGTTLYRSRPARGISPPINILALAAQYAARHRGRARNSDV
jgi:hypothetical protein